MFLSSKGGGDVEGGNPAKQRERQSAMPESTMTQKIKKTLSIYANPRQTSVHRAYTYVM